ncbi:MAG: hypothetical protein WHS46_11390 [Desulfosoma sp.]
MESKRLVSAPLSQIDWEDHTFAVPSYVPDERLEQSLETCGVLTPPTLWEKTPHRFVILDGFKRLFWLRCRCDHVQALVHPTDAEHRKLLAFRLETKMFSRPLNLAEKVHIVAKYATLTTQEDLQRRICPTLGISGAADTLPRWCSIATWPSNHLAALAQELIADKTALLLTSVSHTDREAFLDLIQTLRCSASLQVEILERCKDIAQRDGVTWQTLLSASEIQNIVKDPERNRREKTAAVRELLKQWRFPRLWKKMTAIQNAIAQMSLPSNMSLAPPAYLEGEVWELKVHFRHPEALAASVQKAASLAQSQEFQNLFHLVDHPVAFHEDEPTPFLFTRHP